MDLTEEDPISIPPKRFRINNWIRSPKLRVIGDDGEALGILTLEEAQAAARAKNLDLVEVSPKSMPPVAKIMDYGKFKYTMEKRNREARRRQKAVTLKEVKMRTKIGDHDFDFKKRRSIEFLADGHKVKVIISFFGREMSHQDLGHVLIQKFIAEIAEWGKLELPPKMEGRNLSCILGPTPKLIKELAASRAAKEQAHKAKKIEKYGADADAHDDHDEHDEHDHDDHDDHDDGDELDDHDDDDGDDTDDHEDQEDAEGDDGSDKASQA